LGHWQLPGAWKLTFHSLAIVWRSALEFLGQSEQDATAGSAALRRAVVIAADHELSQLSLDSVLIVGRLSGLRRTPQSH